MLTTIGPGSHIRSHAVIYAGNRIGARFTTGHFVTLREMNHIGSDVSVGTSSTIEHRTSIGDRVRIHSNVFIPEFTRIEDDVWIGPKVCVINARLPASSQSKNYLAGVEIRKRAIIGANATLLAGITLGERSFVAAGSVVTKDVPAYAVVRGNPARVVDDIRELRYPDTSKNLPYFD